MTVESVNRIAYDEKNRGGRLNSRSVFVEVLKYLPRDLLPKVTILLQDPGYVTIRPVKLTRSDWIRLDKSVNEMGGLWVSNDRFSHWSIPLTHAN